MGKLSELEMNLLILMKLQRMMVFFPEQISIVNQDMCFFVNKSKVIYITFFTLTMKGNVVLEL